MTTPAPAAPASNGSAGAQAPVAAPKADTATGTQKPAPGAVRGPDGKFAPKTEAAPVEPAPKPKLRVKDLELDEDAAYSEIQRGRQASKHLTEAQKRIEKAEALEKQRSERLKAYREDPDSFFADLGIENSEERAQWAAKYLHDKHIKPAEMTAEQRELAAVKAELAAQKKQKEQEAKQAEEAEHFEQQKQHAQQLRTEIGSLIQSGAMPKHPAAVKRVAEKIRAAEAKDISISAADAWAAVKDEFVGDTTRYLSDTSIDDLRRDLSPEAFKAIAMKFIQWGLSKTKKTPGLPGPRQAAPVPQQPATKALNQAELEELMRSQRK